MEIDIKDVIFDLVLERYQMKQLNKSLADELQRRIDEEQKNAESRKPKE